MKTTHGPQDTEVIHLVPARRPRGRLTAAFDLVAAWTARRLISDAPMMSPWLDETPRIDAAERDDHRPLSRAERHLTLLSGGAAR
jgi:hypothetical protein